MRRLSLNLFLMSMLPIEYHLLPVVRRGVALLAAVARYALVGCAVLALAELVLLPLHLVLPGILCGMVSAFLLHAALMLVVLLVVWCHAVLLAGQGLVVTRWLVRVGGMLAPLLPVCWVYTLVTGRLLLYRQGELPLILTVLLVAVAGFNIPKMAAAHWQLQVRVVAVPVLLVAAFCLDVPGMLLPCAAVKLLLAYAAASPLRQLAWLAPRVISMPERD